MTSTATCDQTCSSAAFELVGYQTNLKNELVRFEVPGQPDVSYFRNSGTSRHRGFEATLAAATSNGLVSGDLSFTRVNARYVEYEVDGNDYADNRIPGVAFDRVQLRIRYTPNNWWVEAFGGHVSRVQANDANTVAAPGYEILDLRVGLEEVALGSIIITPWVGMMNAFDEDYHPSVAVNAFGSRFFEPGPTQSFQVGLRARFGSGN